MYAYTYTYIYIYIDIYIYNVIITTPGANGCRSDASKPRPPTWPRYVSYQNSTE